MIWILTEDPSHTKNKPLLDEEDKAYREFLKSLDEIRLQDLGDIKVIKEPKTVEENDVRSMAGSYMSNQSLRFRSSGNSSDLWKSRNLKNLFSLAFVIGVAYLLYGNSLLINQKMGFDKPVMNGVLLGVSEILGNVIIYFIANEWGRKKVNLVTNCSLVICSFIIFAIGFLNMHSEEVGFGIPDFSKAMIFTGTIFTS